MPPANGPTDAALDELDRKARAAGGIEWHQSSLAPGIVGARLRDGRVDLDVADCGLRRPHLTDEARAANAAHVAAANPKAVIALVERVRKAEAAVAEMAAAGSRAVTSLIACEAKRDALRTAVEDEQSILWALVQAVTKHADRAAIFAEQSRLMHKAALATSPDRGGRTGGAKGGG